MTFSWLSAVVLCFKNSLQIYLRKTWPMQAWITVVSWSLYFWKSVFSFLTDGILKSDGDFIKSWKFTDRQAVIETTAVVYEHTKGTQNNTKHFLFPIRSRHPLEFLEMVRWESVPRGSSALTWKLSSRLFSRTDWLPLGLRGCRYVWNSAWETYLSDTMLWFCHLQR